MPGPTAPHSVEYVTPSCPGSVKTRFQGGNTRIELGTSEDIEEILSLVKDCMDDMDDKGIEQWTDYYPKPWVFIQDLERGTLYKAMENRRIIGIMVISEDQDKEYETVEWMDKDGRFAVIHRMAVRPEFQRKGVASRLMYHAENVAIAKGFTSIRLDTYSGNGRSLNFYSKMGYKRILGHIHFPELEGPYYCFEKILKKG